ncbi:MAG: DUF4265 domain-containing protein [Acidobacteria bacterium]|nr:DUF4265 domain-containing protein [Acidobacteriota bacterium]MBK8150801.1 DUF4265 domain-containing protein [Acidobacteriota bacterium]
MFEICCIPFFVYDLALGDLVTTASINGKNYVIDDRLKESNLKIFRIWLADAAQLPDIILELKRLGAIVEMRGSDSRLLAIAVEAGETTDNLRNVLSEWEASTLLTFEDGTICRGDS